MGLKALAIYRDGSKESQPLNTSSETSKAAAKQIATPRRERLPDTRNSITHKFNIAGHEGYITVGLYDDRRPGELFITMAKEGSTIGGLMDCFGTAVSMSLQYGVPLEVYVNKFSHTRFEPLGYTNNPDIRMAKSIVDYIFRWLGMTFLPGFREASLGLPAAGGKGDVASSAGSGDDADPELKPAAKKAGGQPAGRGTPNAAKSEATSARLQSSAMPANGHTPNGHNGHHGKSTNGNGAHRQDAGANGAESQAALLERAGVAPRARTSAKTHSNEQWDQFAGFQLDAPSCDMCGAITVRNGNCYLCHNCGNSMGCS